MTEDELEMAFERAAVAVLGPALQQGLQQLLNLMIEELHRTTGEFRLEITALRHELEHQRRETAAGAGEGQ